MTTREKFFNKGMLVFALIGAANALLTLGLMYAMYDLLSFGYWYSSAIAFFICSVISFILNKKYTFKNDDKILVTAIKFSVVIVVCYTAAYMLARPLAAKLFSIINTDIDSTGIERIALLVGQVVFTALNYLGQRYFAFAQRKSKGANAD